MSQKIRNQAAAGRGVLQDPQRRSASPVGDGQGIEDLGRVHRGRQGTVSRQDYALSIEEAEERAFILLMPQFGRALTEYMIEGLEYVEAEAAWPRRRLDHLLRLVHPQGSTSRRPLQA